MDNAQPPSGTHRGVGWNVNEVAENRAPDGWPRHWCVYVNGDFIDCRASYSEAHAAAIQRCNEIADRLRAERGVTVTTDECGTNFTKGMSTIRVRRDGGFYLMHDMIILPKSYRNQFILDLQDCHAEMVAEFGE